MQGRIIKAISGFFYVECNGNTYECKAKGIFRKKEETPVVGDIVEFDEINEKEGNVISIGERKNILVRPPISNIDIVIIVAAIKIPAISTLFIDKQLAYLRNKGIDCIICINKSDLGEANDIVDIYRNIGYDVVLTSAKDDTGVDVLKEKIVGKTAVFVGNSGVGKSSLTNKLLKTKVMEEGDLSKIERGKQTTRHTELLKISDNTYIADSPGFSSFELGEIDDIASLFVEFNEYIGECKYRDCRHIKEDDCAIKKALAEGKISKSRYDNFCLLANKQ